MMKKKVRLSQCMIVKNEEKNIARALSWGKGIVWEQIVVDTGSTDRTVEIAERMGAKVLHFQWIDDFSAAKNFAIDQARGNWIAFLDADEYLSPEHAARLMKILEHIEDTIPDQKKPHILRSALVDLSESGKPTNVTVQDRFFRNLKHLRYFNRIHEQIRMEEGYDLLVAGIEEEISVLHTGYTKTVYEETRKMERNIRLLEKELAQNPSDYGSAVYLAEALAADGRIEEAEPWFRTVLEQGYDRIDSLRRNHVIWGLMNIQIDRETDESKEEFRLLYQKGMENDASFPDFDYFMGFREFKEGMWSDAIRHLESALTKLDQYTGTTTVYLSGNLPKVYSMMIHAYLRLDQPAMAVRYSILALRLDQNQENILNVLLDLLRKDGGDAEGTYQLLTRLYQLSSLRDKLYVMRSAKTVGFHALYKKIDALITDSERTLMESPEE